MASNFGCLINQAATAGLAWSMKVNRDLGTEQQPRQSQNDGDTYIENRLPYLATLLRKRVLKNDQVFSLSVRSKEVVARVE